MAMIPKSQWRRRRCGVAGAETQLDTRPVAAPFPAEAGGTTCSGLNGGIMMQLVADVATNPSIIELLFITN